MIDLTKETSTMERKMLLLHRIYPSMDKKLIKVERRVILYKGNQEDCSSDLLTTDILSEGKLGCSMSTDVFRSSIGYKPTTNPTLNPNETQKIMSKKNVVTDPLGQYGEFSGTLSMTYSTNSFQVAIMIDILNRNNKIDYHVHWRSDNSMSIESGSFVDTAIYNTPDGILKYYGPSLYLISMIYDVTHYSASSTDNSILNNEDHYILLHNKVLNKSNIKYLFEEYYDDMWTYNAKAYEKELDEYDLANIRNLGVIKQIKNVIYVTDTFGVSLEEKEGNNEDSDSR